MVACLPLERLNCHVVEAWNIKAVKSGSWGVPYQQEHQSSNACNWQTFHILDRPELPKPNWAKGSISQFKRNILFNLASDNGLSFLQSLDEIDDHYNQVEIYAFVLFAGQSTDESDITTKMNLSHLILLSEHFCVLLGFPDSRRRRRETIASGCRVSWPVIPYWWPLICYDWIK
jgi:hypothetical protein